MSSVSFTVTGQWPPPPSPGERVYRCAHPCHRVARRSFDVKASYDGEDFLLTIWLCYEHGLDENVVSFKVVEAWSKRGL